MNITILTLFPKILSDALNYSIIKRAQDNKFITLSFINLRDFALDTYKSVDDHPYGGGTGMILRVDIIDRALKKVKTKNSKVILLDAQGTTYRQNIAKKLSRIDDLILICGHYEGVDERVRKLVDEEISIGDYVLTGGEIPALVVVDSVTRLIPGVLSKTDATVHESFSQNYLEYPQYTRPKIFKSMSVPDVLTKGNHANIQAWRKTQAIIKTEKKRPDLLKEKKGQL